LEFDVEPGFGFFNFADAGGVLVVEVGDEEVEEVEAEEPGADGEDDADADGAAAVGCVGVFEEGVA
jgi:hypothetical protein